MATTRIIQAASSEVLCSSAVAYGEKRFGGLNHHLFCPPPLHSEKASLLLPPLLKSSFVSSQPQKTFRTSKAPRRGVLQDPPKQVRSALSGLGARAEDQHPGVQVRVQVCVSSLLSSFTSWHVCPLPLKVLLSRSVA